MLVEVTVHSKGENSEDFCANYVHEFGLRTWAVREHRLKRGSNSGCVGWGWGGDGAIFNDSKKVVYGQAFRGKKHYSVWKMPKWSFVNTVLL